jgi:aarF domain-containing kinase
MLSLGRQARRQVQNVSISSLGLQGRSGLSSSSKAFPVRARFIPTTRPILSVSRPRYYSTESAERGHSSRAHWQAGPNVSRWQIIVPFGAAGLALYLYNRTPLALEDGKAGTIEAKKEEEFSQFAKSVEDVEDEEKMLHRNAFMRTTYRIGAIIQDYIIEPLGTTKRFIVLVFLFAPVILTMPMLLVGRRREGGRRRGRRAGKDQGGTRWGAKWWYGFLVKQMERAGPTFIKVSVI